uniref:2-phospho-L-lactate transferase n=1 Tax=Heterorhabditis bacteriophora TaxID=37862 RepID=A0A1I7WF73_HETBA
MEYIINPRNLILGCGRGTHIPGFSEKAACSSGVWPVTIMSSSSIRSADHRIHDLLENAR